MAAKRTIVLSRVVNAIVMVASLLILTVVASCNNQILEEGAKKPDPQKDPVVAYYRLTTDSTHIEYVDSMGQVIKTGQISSYGKLVGEPPLYVDQIYPWQKATQETLRRGITTNEQENKFSFNYGVNTIKSVIALVDFGGRLIPRWPEDEIEVRASSISINEAPQNGLYYAETTVVYGLYYKRSEEGRTKEIELDDVTQPLIAQENFKDEFLGIRVVRQSHRFNSGSWDPETEILTCTDTVFYTEQWKSGLKNDSWVLVHPQNKIKVSESGNIVDDLSKVVGKSWTNGSANLNGYRITETWVSKSLRESKVAVEANGQTFDIVDSIHICRWDPDGGAVETANKIRLNFAREGMPVDKCHGYKTVNLQQKDIKEVKFLETLHLKFPTEADVNTTNKSISVDHKDRAWFLLTYNDNSSEKDSILYDVNHLFSYTVVNYIPADLKGKTLDIDANGNVYYNGKVVLTITFKSRTVKNLTYQGKDYTDKAAKCDLTPKKAFFGESTITVTLSHDSENVTAKIPATYNSVKTYKVKGNPVHVSWNSVTGTYQLTCNNKVIVVEVMMDDSEGKTFELPYISYNFWTASGKIGGEVEQEELDAIINQPFAINGDGKVTILGSSMTFTHTMKANKVTKDSWSYQPTPCEAVATYLTPLSASQGRVDIYHEGNKVGSFMVDLGFTIKEKPIEPEIIPGLMLAAWFNDSYRSSNDFHYLWHKTSFHYLMLTDGVYTVHSRSLNATSDTESRVTTISAALAKRAINDGKPLTYVGDSGEDEIGYIDKIESQGDWCKIVYRKADGSLDKALSDTEHAFHKNDKQFQRDPIRGIWKDGKIEGEGKVIYITGSEN